MKTARADKAMRLFELGWTRISASGAQSWRHPDGRAGTWTLAAAWLAINGKFNAMGDAQ